MGRFPAALAVAVALLALVPGAQPDMTFLKMCLDNVLPKTSNLWTKASSDNTFFLPTDTVRGWESLWQKWSKIPVAVISNVKKRE
ncbi:hypothetical protein TSOC_012739 [Tetrabaena socialis]|uniref:Uncharacterized protein n=1 Tax=Tetrabaena socialis TaxID=47790 RepID=A0A2J7ZM90_9CHLO|nr:hypothetical protein TSOC_012739 [Tetrabaena socialis]|eukprot:PNH01384.1 hypothetical protein TSOC_012739 [Tetrabaena socialis]